MTDELETFYRSNDDSIDQSYIEFCFYENRFETVDDAKKYYYNESNFWEFVENSMEAKRNWG